MEPLSLQLGSLAGFVRRFYLGVFFLDQNLEFLDNDRLFFLKNCTQGERPGTGARGGETGVDLKSKKAGDNQN